MNWRIWISFDIHELQLRCLSLRSSSVTCQRGSIVTESIVKEQFAWRNMKRAAFEFVTQCLYFLTAWSGDKVLLPLAATLDGSRPNELVDFDYLKMGPSTEGYQYILLFKGRPLLLLLAGTTHKSVLF